MKFTPFKQIVGASLLAASIASPSFAKSVAQMADDIDPQVVQWRHHFHQNPELSNREYETAKYIATYLKGLGLEVQTGVAHTGVVAILDSGKPGPVVALRADMDGLPVTEIVDLPWASKAKSTFKNTEVGVMHACGHDTHMAMLMGAAKILVAKKAELTGKVKFIFQPAEEGAPEGEDGGAELMVKEGALKNPDVDAIFGLHINSQTDVGVVKYRSGGIMAAVDPYKIVVKGKQAHGAYPWLSVDPIVTAAQIIMGLQTVVSREADLTQSPAVVTVGSIHGGIRSNIIPNEVEIIGTIRTLDQHVRDDVHEGVRRKAEMIAKSMGATAEVTLPLNFSYPVTYNSPELMREMLPSLVRTAGEKNVQEVKPVTGAEDFSFFQEKVPGVYLFVGGKAKDIPVKEASAHHTPGFEVEDSGMKLGVKLLTNLTMDYMKNHTK